MVDPASLNPQVDPALVKAVEELVEEAQPETTTIFLGVPEDHPLAGMTTGEDFTPDARNLLKLQAQQNVGPGGKWQDEYNNLLMSQGLPIDMTVY